MTHDHHHPNPDQIDLAEMFTQETWDARYAESERIWSGNPNPRLVEHVAELSAGDALEVGCGEGADAVWLATKGWRVTALDVSQVALDKTAAHAEEAGVADRVTTVRHDLMSATPLPGDYDLVSMQFMHPPPDLFDDVHRRVGAAVRPDGTLLVVAHHPHDVESGVREPHGPDLLFTPDRVVQALGVDAWDIRVADTPTRTQVIAERAVTVTDTVVLAVRR